MVSDSWSQGCEMAPTSGYHTGHGVCLEFSFSLCPSPFSEKKKKAGGAGRNTLNGTLKDSFTKRDLNTSPTIPHGWDGVLSEFGTKPTTKSNTRVQALINIDNGGH